MGDIDVIKEHIKNAEALGKTKKEGLENAAKHFNVTYSAVNCRLWKYEHGMNLSGLKNRKTTKIPLKRTEGKRESYKKNFNSDNTVLESSEKSITIKIKNVKIDLKKGTITILY